MNSTIQSCFSIDCTISLRAPSLCMFLDRNARAQRQSGELPAGRCALWSAARGATTRADYTVKATRVAHNLFLLSRTSH